MVPFLSQILKCIKYYITAKCFVKYCRVFLFVIKFSYELQKKKTLLRDIYARNQNKCYFLQLLQMQLVCSFATHHSKNLDDITSHKNFLCRVEEF